MAKDVRQQVQQVHDWDLPGKLRSIFLKINA